MSDKTCETCHYGGLLDHEHICPHFDGLAKNGGDCPGWLSDDPLKVITVRLPMSLREALKDEAWRARVSLNKLCILKLTGGDDASTQAQAR